MYCIYLAGLWVLSVSRKVKECCSGTFIAESEAALKKTNRGFFNDECRLKITSVCLLQELELE